MIDDYASPGPGRAIAGVLATLAWIAFWAFAIWGDYTAAILVRREMALSLGEWGTLIAAIFAPIGVLWLVLGYFQQADALARNTAALSAHSRALVQQSEQLAMLVQEQARQAAVATTLAELDLAAQRRHEAARRAVLTPDFRFVSASFSAGHHVATFAMVNAGGTAYGLRFESGDFREGRIKPAEVVERNAGFSVYVSLDPVLRDGSGAFTIRCRDVEGFEHAFPFRTEAGGVVPADAPSMSRHAESAVR